MNENNSGLPITGVPLIENTRSAKLFCQENGRLYQMPISNLEKNIDVGIVKAEINTDGHLIIYYSNAPETPVDVGGLTLDKLTPNQTTFFEYEEYQNLIDPATLSEKGWVVNSTGGQYYLPNNFPNSQKTDYIPVEAGATYYIGDNGAAFIVSNGALYDENKAYVSNIPWLDSNSKSAFTASCDGYVAFCRQTGLPETLQLNKGALYPYSEYGVKVYSNVKIKNEYIPDFDISTLPEKSIPGASIADKAITPDKTTFIDNITNLFNPETVSVGAIIKTSGSLSAGFTSWSSSDYIPVKANVTYYFSNDEEACRLSTCALYDSDKKFVIGYGDDVEGAFNYGYSITAQQDGYLRVSKNGGFPDKFQIEANEITSYKEYGVVERKLKEEYLPKSFGAAPAYEGKKILILGDSITALASTTGWVQYFKASVNPSVCVNVAVAGATWHDKEPNQEYNGNPLGSEPTGNVIGNQVQKVINNYEAGNTDYSDFDVIIIAAGTNDDLTADDTIENVDSQFVTAYGTNSFSVVPIENVNRQLIAGAMRYTYEKLIELYPNAIFAVCTPLQETKESYASIYNKGELIKYIASRLSINCWNSRDCGILNIYEYGSSNGRDLIDGIHPNANGGKKIGKYNAREFRRLFD